jgi:hypothetical protein
VTGKNHREKTTAQRQKKIKLNQSQATKDAG